MPPVFSMALPMLWLVRGLALAAMATSFWLTLQKWLSPRISLAGCGGSEGCATLLDSRWSNWFSIPVTLLAGTVWLAVLLLTLPASGRWLGRTADQLLAACAVLLLAGALWFGMLMAVVVKVWCPWCAALHLAALVVGGLLLYSTWRAARRGELGLFSVASQAGVAGLALLVLGQLFGKSPDTHILTAESAAAPLEKSTAGAASTVSFLNGTLVFSRQDLPSLGNPGAQHLMASFSDYTCPSCRAQYSDLKVLLRSAPDTYALLILPTPLDRSCNPHLAGSVQDHPGACTLARLSLAVWKAAPQHFAAFHDFLMTAPLPMDPAGARIEASHLAPSAMLDLENPWITTQITDNIEAWHRLSSETSKLPKLLLRDDVVLHGSTSSRERFLGIIEETFTSAPPVAIPVTTLSR